MLWAPCQERREKWLFEDNHFSLFFFESFLNLVLADQSLMIGWAGLPFLFWALDLADGFLAICFHVFIYRGLLDLLGFGPLVDHWGVRLWTPGGSLRCWALDPWWINKVLDSVCRAPKKWASTVCMHINIFILSNAFLVSTLHKDSHSISSPKSSWKNNFLHRVYITLLLWE